MKNGTLEKIIGGILLLAGIVAMCLSIRVNNFSFSFGSFSNQSACASLLLIAIIEGVGLVVFFDRPAIRKIFLFILVATGIAFLITFILSLHFWLTSMSLLQLIIYLALIISGIGLLIRGKYLSNP